MKHDQIVILLTSLKNDPRLLKNPGGLGLTGDEALWMARIAKKMNERNRGQPRVKGSWLGFFSSFAGLAGA